MVDCRCVSLHDNVFLRNFCGLGGVAYQAGFVAVSICLTHGVAALLAGYFIAARWRATGVSSAGEFVYIRDGSSFCANVILKVILPNLTQDGPKIIGRGSSLGRRGPKFI